MKQLILLFLALPFTAFAGINDKNYGSIVIDEITSIYDGDTFRATIKGWPALVGERIPIRIAGIDTPELRGKCEKEKKLGKKAKQFTVTMLRAGKTVELRDIKRGKYFRLVAFVFIDGKS